MREVTIAIPTLDRGPVLLDTLRSLLALPHRAAEILVVDQTKNHPSAVSHELDAMARRGEIRWTRLPAPSVPHAMNFALREATHDLVLFLDDDIVPSAALIAAHERAHETGVWAVVGQILQPGQSPCHAADPHGGVLRDLEFPFNHDAACDVENVMAGNLSVDRRRALSIGGFDENFTGAAYRFETDFARRIVAAGGRIRFAPEATIGHLHVPSGGIRSHGDHRRSMSPAHAAGDYYFARLHVPQFGRYALRRFVSNVFTRWHLRHPWFLLPKAIGEVRGYLLSRKLVARGRRLAE